MIDAAQRAPIAAPAMLGKAGQLGFVVRDLEAAMRHWIEVLGVAPFIYMENGVSQPVRETIYHGHSVHVELKLGFAFIGDMQIELIEQRNGAPSPYRAFLDAGSEGLQHLGFWVPDHRAAVARCEASGYRCVYRIAVSGPSDPIVYFQSPSAIGPMLELVPPAWRRSREAMKKATQAWTGQEPIIRHPTYVDFLTAAGVRFD